MSKSSFCYPVRLIAFFTALNLATGPVLAQAANNQPPQVSHQPVTAAVRGQGLTLKAKVTDDHAKVQAVTLYYTLSKDAAPFQVPMKPVGLDLYLGTIEAGINSLSYYIEAQDELGAAVETPWRVIEIRDAKSPPDAAGTVTPSEGDDGGMPWGYIAAGALVAGGAALLLAGDSGGGGSSSDDDTSNTNGTVDARAGTYGGSVTTCFTPPGGSPSCETHGMTIIVDSSGRVLSDTLNEDQQMTGRISGDDFTLTAEPPEGESAGEINYNGTVIGDNRIVGTISGSSTTTNGTGTYSGSFQANK
jgi:hypothetical protein